MELQNVGWFWFIAKIIRGSTHRKARWVAYGWCNVLLPAEVVLLSANGSRA